MKCICVHAHADGCGKSLEGTTKPQGWGSPNEKDLIFTERPWYHLHFYHGHITTPPLQRTFLKLFHCSDEWIHHLPSGKTNENLPARLLWARQLLHWSFNSWKLSLGRGCWASHIRPVLPPPPGPESLGADSKLLEPHGKYWYLPEEKKNCIFLEIPYQLSYPATLSKSACLPSQTLLL